MRTTLLLAILFSLVVSSHACALGTKPTGDQHVYKTVGDRALRLYATKPKDWAEGDRRPAMVFFHGGGWTGGEPGQFTQHSQYFASRGIVCFQVQYRLLDKTKKEPPITCTEDARDAMLWIRTRSEELGIDPKRIASAGGSAGGHLAAFLGCVDAKADATTSSKSNAMVLFNPVYNNGPDGWGSARVGDRFREFSPAHNITKDDPPSIVFLGSNDKLIPVATAEKFRDDCKAVGVKSELYVYEGQGHGFFNASRGGDKMYQATVIAADQFLEKLGWVEGPPTLGATEQK